MADPEDDSQDAETRGGAEEEEGEIDPELVAIAEERSRGSVIQPVLYISVIALGCWMLADFWPDVQYFFSDREAKSLGTIHKKYAGSAQDHPYRKVDLPHNDYVEVEGIPDRMSRSDNYGFFRLIGAPVYVQTPDSDAVEEPKEQTMAERFEQLGVGTTERSYFRGKGRLIALWKMPDRYRSFQEFYRKQYGTRFCGNLTKDEREDIRSRRRVEFIDSYRKKYREASPEERDEQGLKPKPSKKEIEEALEGNPVCLKAYLFLDGRSPTSVWRIMSLAALFAAFILLNVYWLIRWVRKLFGTDIDPSIFEEEDEMA